MNRRNYKCAGKAAEWWTEQIRNSSDEVIKELIPFEELLAESIQNVISRNAQMNISTFNRHSTVLEEVAAKARMSINYIPVGYEMRIIMNNIYVYDSIGKLIESF